MNADAMNGVRQVSASQANVLVEDGAVLLDVREPEETASGRAGVAVTIPLGELTERVDELSNDRTIVVVCRTGNRSLIAASALKMAGFDAVNLDGGMLAWQDAGLPIVSDGGRQGIVL
jgi:rhodanese-related sulfurtransferase